MREWFEKSTLGALPARAARLFGEREALYFEGSRCSFREMDNDVDQVARALMTTGIQPGEKVALWLNNRPEWMHFMFAILKIGAVLVPINTRLRQAEVAYQLQQSNTTTLITADRSGPVDYLAMVDEMLPKLAGQSADALALRDFPDLKRVVVLGGAPHPGTLAWPAVLGGAAATSREALAERAAAVDPDAIAFIMYTSGTTGFPKGVMHDHAVIRNITDRVNRMAITADDVILMYLPLFHVFGFGEGPLVSLVSGARQVLTVTFDPAESLDFIERERVTLTHGFDLHFQDMMNVQRSAPRDVSSLRTGLLAAGMHNSTAIAYATQKELLPTLSCYGMSECGVGAGLNQLNSTAEQRCESSGYPAPGYEFRIIDPETGHDQPVGTPGEMLVKGYMLMRGYYAKPEETAKAIDADGWLHSGDMGLLRPDGCLRFIGRYKDMLKVGGENVDPMEVESLLLEHPGVHQVAVVGYPDARLGEVAVAFIQPTGDNRAKPEEFVAWCKGKIASFKAPRHAILIEEFPMTGSGKIRKVPLREMAVEQIKPRSA